jgi:hypothetical protein
LVVPATCGTWIALDSDSKLIISWLVGGRDGEYALAFMGDAKDRFANRVQLTDGHRAYLEAVEEAFGADIDYYSFIKMHKSLRMSPAMAADVADKLWSMADLCEAMDAVAPKPGPRGPYKKARGGRLSTETLPNCGGLGRAVESFGARVGQAVIS